jgi:hypothetical protein
MYIDMTKIVSDIHWEISLERDMFYEHKITVKAKNKDDYTEAIISLTLKEAEDLVEQLGFAIQDYNKVKGE